MSIRLDGTTDRAYRTANLPARNAFSIVAWVRRASTPSAYRAVFGLGVSTSSPAIAYEMAYTSVASLHISWYGSTSGTATFSNQQPFANDRWFPLALVSNGTLYGWAGHGVPEGVSTTPTGSAFTAFTPAVFWVGDNGWGEGFDGNLAHVRIWNEALSAVEIQREMQRREPTVLRTLTGYYPLVGGDLRDHSGVSVTLTTAGTVTAGHDPSPALMMGRRRWSIADVIAAGGGGGATPKGPLMVGQAVSRAAFH